MKKYINKSLIQYSSFKTGGNADVLYIPENIEELVTLLEEHPDIIVLGNISNTLITDKGVRNPLAITTEIKNINICGNMLTAQCGASLSSIAVQAMKCSLKGMEFLYGIPGTLGGGIYMNAGAYGGEISDSIVKVRLWNRQRGIFEQTKEEMEFAYRKSRLSECDDILLEAVFKLEKGAETEIKEKMDELMAARRAKQPLDYPSCGSTFKRPEGYFAGKLIEECGLKGKTIGGAAVSEKHAGFVINKSNAKSKDILDLIEYIKTVVYNKKGIKLEEEIKIVGEL
ncbi:UDP-N-acetylmuramate dehydrogenase [Eubacteriales bacterium OttesenSCG-928-G02]|nr:UDP-N-acetylmuramate dehydrogenase [Eubacteriales bacterium OttesenSCG-928-G02]